MLARRWAVGAVAAALMAALAPALAHADDPVVGSRGHNCKGRYSFVTTCAAEPGRAAPRSGEAPSSAPTGGGGGKGGLPPQKCRVTKLAPQPPANSALWEGHKPSDGGAVYTRMCHFGPRGIGAIEPFWAAKPPAAQAVDPEALAREAVDRMRLTGPDIQSPRPGRTYLVGMPLWMHVAQSPTTFGPNSSSATAGAVTVTARAKVKSIRWAMGDGTSVTCQGPGASYRAAYGQRPSPDCGHVYARTSAGHRGNTTTVTATATWQITWNGDGQQGAFTQTRTSQVPVSVGELQALG